MSIDILQTWYGQTCVLATMHKKEAVIAPLLKAELGLETIVPEAFDTDRFGTFTREIKRPGSQLETARKKASEAMRQTGLSIGIASEGSFGTHPAVPFIPINTELVILIDAIHTIEVVGQYRSDVVRVHGQEVFSVEEAIKTAHAWGFPEQGVIVRQSEKSKHHIYKEIRTEKELEEASHRLLSRLFRSSLWIETDMRAHRCPARQESIRQATLSLIKNCHSLCPRCGIPGFVVIDAVSGLPCRDCGQASDLIKETVFGCQACHYTETRVRTDISSAEPKDCQWCNP